MHAAETVAHNPWNRANAPVKLSTQGVPLDYWKMNRNSASPPPLSPASELANVRTEEIILIPYGSSTLRIAAFPWVK